MKNKSIGVFDSGLGGLTVVKELKKILPNENVVYFGDTARIPYGGKSKETIYKYTKDDINFLLSKNIKAIVVACGTASSVVDKEITDSTNIPIITVINPASKMAITKSKNNNIGVIATSATISSKSYVKEIEKLGLENNLNYEVFGKDCPLFVPLVENGYFHKDDAVARLVANDYLSYFDNKYIDTLILGCTHYPLLYDLIADIMGKNINLIDAGKETAIVTKEILKQKDLLNTSENKSKYEYYVSDRPQNFLKEAEIFLEEKLSKVTTINI